MKFTATIACDSDAFSEDPNREVARLLRQAADKVEHGSTALADVGTLRDINGNTVGTFHYTET